MSLIPLSLTLWGSRFCGSKYSGLGTVHVEFKSHLCHLTSCVIWVKFIHFLGPQHFCLQSRENYSFLAEVWGLNGMRCVVRLLSYVQLLQPHGWQHARLPCPSLPPRDCSDSYQLNRWCHPTVSSSVTPFSFCPQSFPASGSFPVSQLFTSVWPKYWSFSFSISPSNEYSGLISFRTDWFDLHAVEGYLKSLLQHHSLKASVLQCSAFLIVQLWHQYTTTEKTTALVTWTFVSKVMSLLFNMLFRLVEAFLLRSKCLLISWLQSPSAVILEP